MIEWHNILDNREEGVDTLAQAKLVMVKLLRVFDVICRENNLTYWLSSGTLLGAIRHNGFIPWDDDIDVEMPRKDYEIFIKLAPAVLLGDVFLQTRQTDKGYPLLFAKLRDKYSTYEESNLHNCNCHKGIFIDIFPIEYSRHPKCQKVFKLFSHGTCYTSLSKGEDFIQHWIGRIVKKCVLLSDFPLYDWQNRLFRTSFCKATCYSYGMEFHEIKTFPINCLFPLRKHCFEGYEFNIPNDYDKILKIYYGDYMKLPPLEERQSHNIGIFPFTPCDHNETLRWEK